MQNTERIWWYNYWYVNKKLNPIVTELFIRGRKLNISLIFVTQSYFAVPKNKLYTLFYYKNSKQSWTSTNYS